MANTHSSQRKDEMSQQIERDPDTGADKGLMGENRVDRIYEILVPPPGHSEKRGETPGELLPGSIHGEALFFTLADLLSQSVFITDAEGSVVYLNRMGRSVFGHSPPSPEMFFIHEDRDCVRRMMAEDDIRIHEVTAIKKGGCTFTALLQTTRLNALGPFSGRVFLVADLSEKQNLEQALRKMEQRCRDIFQNTWEF
jgi:PAS domain-containing protein